MSEEPPPTTNGPRESLDGCESREPPGIGGRIRNAIRELGSSQAATRLEGTVEAYCTEFAAFLDALNRVERRADADADADAVVDHVETLLGRTATHLQAGRVQRGWACFHAARRVDLYAYARYDRLSGGETTLLRDRAAEIHREATETLRGWRREAVSDLLLDSNGTVKRTLSTTAVIRARHLVDEANQANHVKRRYLQRQLRYLLGLGVVALALFLWGLTESNPLDMSSVTTTAFVVYVPLFGILGASLFGVRSVSKTATSTNVPQNFTPFGVVLARTFIGAISAVALYLGLTADVVNLATADTGISPALLLGVAFAAGYSERLAPQAVERMSTLSQGDVSR
jgi:hypothetical protein